MGMATARAGREAACLDSDVHGLEIKLATVPTHAVRGVLLKRAGFPAPNVSIALRETGSRGRTVHRAETNSNGAFEFPAVGDGEWRLHAEWKDQDARLMTDEWIDVNGRDLEGLKARLAAPFTVSGRVMLEPIAGQAVPSAPPMLLIREHRGQILFADQAFFTAQPGADGRFRFEGMYPRLLRMEISADSPELAVVYKTHGGAVRGSVEKCGSPG